MLVGPIATDLAVSASDSQVSQVSRELSIRPNRVSRIRENYCMRSGARGCRLTK